MSQITEKEAVQNPLIKYCQNIGWSYVSSNDAESLRNGKSNMIFSEVLRNKITSLNPYLENSEVENVFKKIESVRDSIEGNLEVLKWLRGEKTIFVEKEKREINVNIIDFERLERNLFQITDEWVFTDGKKTNRADIVFLINGIPVCIVETKAPEVEILEGFYQIERYHRETAEIMTYPQFFAITNLSEIYYGSTWNLDKKNLVLWKEGNSFEIKVKTFFNRERVLNLLNEWILFYFKDDEIKKTILREHQIRAIEKIILRVDDPNKKTALIWHTQGSGKTFTMIKTAEMLIKKTPKPTVILVVDRNELEGQLSGWITNILGRDSHLVIRSKEDLKKIIESDYRGLLVSMIHKFDKSDKDLCLRDNVYVLIDEAHRSTSKSLGNYMMAAIPKAKFIGFTGTPVDKTAYGTGTFKTFGKYDKKGYLDKYSISESIKDKTTLPLYYELAPVDMRLKENLLEEEFLKRAEIEGISDIDELNSILEKAVRLKEFLKNRDRIDKICKFIAEHYEKNIEPLGYKSFLVAVDREACALYKKTLDKYLSSDYSKIVYTSSNNDNELLKEFYISEMDEKRIRKDFLKPSLNPKILIVTDKLLTGYDAPILYCMYLDKPMRDHTLLQAIARVNRPYQLENGNEKPFGFIIDFIGIFSRLKKALAFDSDVVESAVKNIDVIKNNFSNIMRKKGEDYLKICKDYEADKCVEKILEYFSDKEKREEFLRFYKEISLMYEIISPDSFLSPYLKDYSEITKIYLIVKNKYLKKKDIKTDDFLYKTKELVRENIEVDFVNEPSVSFKIDDDAISALKNDEKTNKGKVISLLIDFVDNMRSKNKDYLISIIEKANKVLEDYEERKIQTEETLKKLLDFYDEYKALEKEKENLEMDDNTFFIYSTLKKENFKSSALDYAKEISKTISKYPYYRHNPEEERGLVSDIYSILDKAGIDIKDIIRITDFIIENLKNK
ncbi:MAG TPA: HsdR family type I site-specific deoxyribonuclease [Elusimicrobiales bacterium]|nr:HsdR family type I site-specific deoxyribonuclease [Elusimicrobiales bacterium]